MEIKVKYQGQIVSLVDFQAFSTIEKMRELGYDSFRVRSEVSKYECFASFRNEDNDDYINFYPDRTYMQGNNRRVSSNELKTIINVLNDYIHIRNVEESD